MEAPQNNNDFEQSPNRLLSKSDIRLSQARVPLLIEEEKVEQIDPMLGPVKLLNSQISTGMSPERRPEYSNDLGFS